MYKQLNISMDSILIQMHINWTGKYISINKIGYYNSNNLYRHIYEPEKPSPPPPQSYISRWKAHKTKEILGRTQSAPKGQRDANSSIFKLWQQWTIVYLLFNSSPSMYPRGSLYRTPRGNGGSNLSDLEAYGRPRDKWFGHTSRKTPKIFGLTHTS